MKHTLFSKPTSSSCSHKAYPLRSLTTISCIHTQASRPFWTLCVSPGASSICSTFVSRFPTSRTPSGFQRTSVSSGRKYSNSDSSSCSSIMSATFCSVIRGATSSIGVRAVILGIIASRSSPWIPTRKRSNLMCPLIKLSTKRKSNSHESRRRSVNCLASLL